MIRLSNHLLKQMGFEKIPDSAHIEAHFKSINVYEIRGIVSDEASPLSPTKLKHVTNDFSFSIGDSINEICQTLLNDDFTDDEIKWKEENKSTSPYLIILTNLIDPFFCKDGHWKHEGDEIITYDCFSEAKEKLRKKENKTVAALTTSLAATFSSSEHNVSFTPITREIFAETNYNMVLRDLKITTNAKLYTSNKTSTALASSKIDEALSLFDTLHQKVGYFFHLASKESDTLKQFIYYFLAIEIHTHQTFKSLDYNSNTSQLNNIPQRIKLSATKFLVDRQKESKNLSQRFIWCSIHKWNEISDTDIEQFKTIKKFRDSLYHGEEIDEKSLPVSYAKKLALKLLKP